MPQNIWKGTDEILLKIFFMHKLTSFVQKFYIVHFAFLTYHLKKLLNISYNFWNTKVPWGRERVSSCSDEEDWKSDRGYKLRFF